MADIRVFLVEDDPMVVELHRGLVSSVPNFRVVGHAADGQTALSSIAKTRPHLVILDVYMPEKSGLELLRSLRAQTVPVDVIMVTAAHESATVAEALRLGAIDYLIKPFRFERLREALLRYRQMRGYLDERSLSQHDVDAMLSTATQPDEANLPKGLVPQTLAKVKALVEQNGPESLSAEEVAKLLGVSRITARRYLEHLVNVGLVKSEPAYGSIGRPVNRYAWLGSRMR